MIGGLSPDPALFKVVRANTDLEIRTLLRPRFGDFCYDEYEFEMLKEEVQMYREFGADGVVIGILRPDGTMNVEQMEELVRISGDMKVTITGPLMYVKIHMKRWNNVSALGSIRS